MFMLWGHSLTNPFRSEVPKGLYDPIKHHTGIDVVIPEKTPLSLPMRTKVELVARQPEMGLCLYLSDFDGNTLVLAHLSSVDAQIGDIAAKGKVVAFSGNSGSATTAPHVHVEIIAKKPTKGLEFMTRSLQGFDGFNIDPVPYFEKKMTPHWSDEGMEWAKEHEIISYKHDPNDAVTWGELVTVLFRFAKKIIQWVKSL